MNPRITEADDMDAEHQGRRHEARREDDQHQSSPSIAKVLGTVLGVVTLISLIFTAGYNWRSVAILETQQEQFVRKDVQQEQLRNINDRLYEISKQLEQVRGELESTRRRQQP